jgi:hypothetical protein
MSKNICGEWQGYDIQVVDVRPGDTILFHINDDMDVDTVSQIVTEMSKAFPDNVIIPVNEWVLKGMTIVRQATKQINDITYEAIMNQSLEELYPDLFKQNKTSAVKPGEIIW